MVGKISFLVGISCLPFVSAAGLAQVPDGQRQPAAVKPTEPQSEVPAAPASDSEPKTGGEIIVTGTRLPSTFSAPTPVTVVTGDQLRLASPSSVGEALAQLPAFSGSQITSNLGRATSNVGAGQALLNLRNLGSNRTLILLDGERLSPSNPNGSVDVNVIPQVLLSRVDVVTGGASSSYGSDAVAGVVNFITDTRFKGLKLDVSGGETTYHDSGNVRAQLAAGTSFADDRGRVVASADYFRQSGIGLGPNGRAWFDNGPGFSTLPAGSATTFGIIPDPRLSTMAYGGLVDQVTSTSGKTITVPGLSNYFFGPGATLQPFDFGTNRGPSFQSGGSGPKANQGISPTQRRIGAFGHAEYDLTDRITAFAGALYSRSSNFGENFYAFEQGARGFRIYADNPYLPADVKALLTANNVASFRIGRFTQELPWLNRSRTELLRFNGGLKGRLGGSWHWDAGVAYARSKLDFGQQQAIVRNLYAAADAVVNPATGQIVCRSTLAGLDPGCVPINVLGPNAITPAGLSYIGGYDYGYTTVKQLATSVNLRGDFGDKLNFGAGPITMAVGAAYRDEHTIRTVSPLSTITNDCTGLRPTGCSAFSGQYGGYAAYNPSPLDGRVKVPEAYAELGIPLLRDRPLFRSLDLNLAGRVTHYSTSGTVYTWKIGPLWRLSNEFRLRLTRSQDIRAPSANELFSTVSATASQTSQLYPNSTAPGPLQTTTITVTTGNRNLKPEVAQTFTVGGVYTPAWLPGFQASLDYYSIDISGAIASLPAQTIINSCSAGDQVYCNLITVAGAPVTSTAALNGASGISIQLAPTNVAKVRVAGLDAEVAYSAPVAGGTAKLRAIGNYALRNSNSSAAAPSGPIFIGAYGVGGGVPRWTLALFQGFDKRLGNATGFGASLEERIIAAGKINPNYTAAQFPSSSNRVPTIMYLNASAHYDLKLGKADTQLYVTVQNLLNQDPPAVPTSTSAQLPTNFELYDVLGRRFTLGVRVRL